MKHLSFILSFIILHSSFAAFAAEQQFTTQTAKSDRMDISAFTRQDIPFNTGWTCENMVTKTTKVVDLPHDYQFENPWDEKAGGARGFRWGDQKATYTNTFSYDPSWDGKNVFLEFEAIMAHGDIEVNGKKVGESDYGYLGATVDITKHLLKDRPNIVKVHCSTGSQRGSRWYTGGGLIRPVHIIVKSNVNIVEDGLFVTAAPQCPVRDADTPVRDWTVNMTVQLDGFRGAGRANELMVVATIKDPAGNAVAHSEMRAPWSKLRHQEVKLDPVTIANPEIWDIDSPKLYTCAVALVLNGRQIDNTSTTFGFRTVEFSKDFGMKLNGRKVWIFGMANHHDLGALGAAAFEDGIRRMMRTIKKFGYNTVRCAHNPYSKSFYKVADEEGLLVIDELYDKWGFKGGTWWVGSKLQGERWPAHMKRWMMRDRNHPSIICWSFGNEFQMNEDICGYDTDDWGVTTYKMMREYAHRYDPTRLTTCAMFPARSGAVGKNDPKDLYNTYTPPELATVTDISSFNYQPQAYEDYRKCAPWMIFLQSEATTSEWLKPMNLMDREKMIGLCYWGAIEYWGESNGWPKKGWAYSYFCETLEPYPQAWLIESGAYPEKPIIHLGVREDGGEVTNWNEQKSGQEKIRENWTRTSGSKADVVVFSNCDEVELFLNGTSLGRKRVPHDKSSDSNVVWYRDVAYEPGTLTAVGLLGDQTLPVGGDPRGAPSYSICSASAPTRLQLTCDYAGPELAYFLVHAVDAEGRPNLAAQGKVKFTVTGAGKLYAVSNGDHWTDELFTDDIDTKAFHDGSVQLIVRRTGKGEIKVKAESEGLNDDTITISD